MLIIPVIQARMSSRRLPGKILMALGDTTVLAMIVENMRHCLETDGEPWVATSLDPSDDAVADFAGRQAVPLFRGSLDNVALRLLQAAEAAGADAIVRVNGDSPLLDPALVDHAIRLFRAGDADIATNVLTRSFPKGQSVEVIARPALEKAVAAMTTVEEREHVTPYFYGHSDMFRIGAFVAGRPRPELQLSVDRQADLDFCAAILRRIAIPVWQAGWEKCVEAADEVFGSSARNIA